MRKVIFVEGNDQALDTAMQEMTAMINEAFEKQKFLDKQQEDLKEKIEAQKTDLWLLIEARLRELKLLPDDYHRNKYGLHRDENAIFLLDKEEQLSEELKLHPLGNLLRVLLKK